MIIALTSYDWEFTEHYLYNAKEMPNKKELDSQELDFYIPDLNLAFEYNGIYWHSTKFKDLN